MALHRAEVNGILHTCNLWQMTAEKLEYNDIRTIGFTLPGMTGEGSILFQWRVDLLAINLGRTMHIQSID